MNFIARRINRPRTKGKSARKNTVYVKRQVKHRKHSAKHKIFRKMRRLADKYAHMLYFFFFFTVIKSGKVGICFVKNRFRYAAAE